MSKHYKIYHLGLVGLTIFYYIIRTQIFVIEFVALGLLILLLAISIFWTIIRIRNRRPRIPLFLTSMALVFLLTYTDLGNLITIGTLKLTNNRTLAILKKYSNELPVHDLRATGNWIINDKQWTLTSNEKKILTQHFCKKRHLIIGDGYAFFILGGFLDNTFGFAYKLNGNEENPYPVGYRTSYVRPVTDNWIYFETR